MKSGKRGTQRWKLKDKRYMDPELRESGRRLE